MDSKKFEMMFQSPELRTLLWPERTLNAELKNEQLIQKLLSVADDKIEKWSALFFEAVSHNKSNSIHKGTCNKLQKEFFDQAKKLQGQAFEVAAKVIQTLKSKQKESKKEKAKDKTALASLSSLTQTPIQFDRFPLEHTTLSQMRTRHAELQTDNYKKAKALLRELKKRKVLDPELQEMEDKDASILAKQPNKKPPFQLNISTRICNTQHQLDANDVQMGKNRNYLLAHCPHSWASAGLLYDIALRQNVSLFISLLEVNEAPNRCNNFWTEEKIASIPLQDGWRIEHQVSKVVAKGAKEIAGTREPQLVETKLLATRKMAIDGKTEARILTHLHYDAWRDRTAAPCEELLQTLIDRIEELQKEGVKDTPFEVNCKGGIGRTGTIVAIHWIRQKIYEELEKGVALETISINIPELIYALRKQRKSLVSEKEQLVQIYQATATFYERLKAQKQAAHASCQPASG